MPGCRGPGETDRGIHLGGYRVNRGVGGWAGGTRTLLWEVAYFLCFSLPFLQPQHKNMALEF